MNHRLHPVSLGLSVALLSGLGMLVLSGLGLAGFYTRAVKMMKGWHELYSLDAIGITLGTLEGGLWGYVLGWVTGVFYNLFLPEDG